jgi:hypothetical protein
MSTRPGSALLCVERIPRKCMLLPELEVGMSEMKSLQVSVPLPAELRAFVEEVATEQDRSIAGVIRRLVAKAARAHTKIEGRRS